MTCARFPGVQRPAVTALVGIIAGVFVVLAVPRPAAAQAGWSIDRYDVDLTVTSDGAVEVVERIAVDFSQLRRRGIFRTIPVRYAIAPDDPALPDGTDPDAVWREIRIDRVQVRSSAPDDLQRTGPGLTGTTVVLRIGDEDITVTGPQTYEIRYRVEGALNDVDGAAELVWNATGDDWEAPIREASVTLAGASVTAATCVQGARGSIEPCTTASADGEGPVLRAGELRPGTGMTVTATFATGAVTVPAPIVEDRWSMRRGLVGSDAAVPLAALLMIMGLGGVGTLAWRQGRDRVTRGGVSIDGVPEGPADAAAEQRRGLLTPRSSPVQFRPPGDLRPAQLGVLVDERVDPVEITATIVDLAVRGHLRIEETTSGRFRKQTDWTLRRTTPPSGDALLPFEQLLLSELFATGDEQVISALQGTWAGSYAKISEALYDDAVAQGWFARSPEATRTLWIMLGVFFLVAAGGLMVALVRFTTVGAVAIPLVVSALALIVLSGRMPHRTAKGSQRLGETLGFREFVRTAEADRMAFAEQEHLFLEYLPYAVVFGATDKWARAFASLGTPAAAAATAGGGYWYMTSTGRAPSFDQLSKGLSGFSASSASSLTTAPSSSGGGGSSSGGGFGGGGGGSW